MPKPTFQAAAEGLPTRRDFLGKLAVASATGAVLGAGVVAVSQLPAPHPDAELLELGREFEAAWTVERTVEAEEAGSYSVESDKRCEAANDLTRGIVRRIEACRAFTLEGLGVKALAISWCVCGEAIEDDTFNAQATTNVRLAASIVRDLLSARGAA